MKSRSFIAALLFLGGFCALVYQTVWLREFRLIFGASTPATAAVLALFMGGLGLGGWVLGKRADQAKNPLRMYAQLELGIALSSALTPVLLDGIRALYLATGGANSLGYGQSTLIRLLLAALVMGAPVLLMGATLPAAARSVTQDHDTSRRGLALLYGANALGAVMGTLATTFVLFEVFGVRTTLWMASLINVIIGLLANVKSRDSSQLSAERFPQKSKATPKPEHPRAGLPIFIVSSSFLAGFAFFLVELVWYRMAAPLLGGTTFTFGLILAIALLGIGVGGFLYAVAPPRKTTGGALAVTFGLEAVAILLPLAAGDQLAHVTYFLREFGAVSFPRLVFGWTTVVLFLVFPAALVSGYQFPLLVALRGHGETGISRDVALIYGANTVGSILGSLFGGFGLLPWFGAPGVWRMVGLCLAGASLLFLLDHVRKPGRSWQMTGWVVFLAVTSVGLTLVPGPSALWRHTPIGAGRARLHANTMNDYLRLHRAKTNAILEEFDGRESSVAFLATHGLAFSVNGKSDGNAVGDAITTVGLGIIPAALHPSARTAFVIGLGCGQTAGWLGRVPELGRVDVVELEPQMTRFAEKCEQSNLGVLQNPRVHLSIGDGREVLASSSERYDLIVAEPSNPYRSGIASLYSVDFYRDVRAHLAPGGFFGQWLQGYEVHPDTFVTVVSTMRAVFPEVSAFALGPGDFLLLGTEKPWTIQVDALRSRLQQAPFPTALTRVFGVDDVEGLLSLHLANGDYSRRIDGGEPNWNTQDQPILEYQFARAVGRRGSSTSQAAVWRDAVKHGADRPAITGEVDWARVDELRGRNSARLGRPVPEAWARQTPYRHDFLTLLDNGNFLAARQLLEKLPQVAASDLFERLRRLEVAIWTAADPIEREEYQAELKALSSTSALSDVAWLRLLEGKIAQASGDVIVTLAAEALRLARADPWVDSNRIQRILRRVEQELDEPTAHQFAQLLLEAPLASYHLETLRWQLAQEWSSKGLPDRVSKDCARAYSSHVPWEEQALVRRSLCFDMTQVDETERGRARDELNTYLAHESKAAVSAVRVEE